MENAEPLSFLLVPYSGKSYFKNSGVVLDPHPSVHSMLSIFHMGPNIYEF